MQIYTKFRPCAKCGEPGPHYNKYKLRNTKCDDLTVQLALEHFIDHPEVIVRTCKNCGYSWEELPLDAKPPKERR